MSTYTPIASQTLGSAAASVTFSSIPQGYTDLILVCNIAQSSGNNSLRYRFNGDTGSNYSDTYLYGNGTSALSGRDTSQTSGTIYVTGSTTIEANYIVQFMNYSNATTYKTVLGRSNRASSEVAADVGLWRSTSAINSISLAMGGSFPTNNFASGSTFSLYGIQVGDKAQKAQGGNIVTSDGTYVYHTFTSSGSFTTNQALTVDYLVVAGGGGGAGAGGGGGGGGLRSTVTATGGGGSLESALSLSSGLSYPVIIGAGGVGSNSGSSGAGGNGGNSVFATITATGGGGGGEYDQPGATGGSGGGGGWGDFSEVGGARTASPVQGYAGGNNSPGGSTGGGGGGGGAGAVGGNGSGTTGGAGGNGAAVSISGSSITYAGGGGGWGSGTAGSAGTGGGGAGNNGTGSTIGTAGTANTGGGAGSGYGRPAANGGSGIVIIRYAI